MEAGGWLAARSRRGRTREQYGHDTDTVCDDSDTVAACALRA